MNCTHVTERATEGPCTVVVDPGLKGSPYEGQLTDCLNEPDHLVHDFSWTPEPGREQFAD